MCAARRGGGGFIKTIDGGLSVSPKHTGTDIMLDLKWPVISVQTSSVKCVHLMVSGLTKTYRNLFLNLVFTIGTRAYGMSG